MADSYYQFYVGDYQRDTGDLTLVEHGAYRVLLDYYYSHGSLPLDRDRCLRIARAFTQSEREAVDTIMSRFFRQVGDVFRNKRADIEIEKRKAFISAQSERGRKGAEARWSKADAMPEGMAQAMPTPMLEQWPDDGLPSPTPTKEREKKEKKEKKSGVKKPPPPPRKKFLDSVFLTDLEHQKLQEAMGQKSLEDGIDKLDYSITVKDGKYKDHYKTLLNWHKRGYLTGGGNGKGLERSTGPPKPKGATMGHCLNCGEIYLTDALFDGLCLKCQRERETVHG